MRTVTLDDTQIAYRDEGGGMPLLLIHAFPLSGAMWELQLEALAPHARLIAPDLRGFGQSTLGAPPSSLDQYADDLVGLLDQLGIERAAVAGLSMGGYIAFALLRRHRHRVAGLVLADTRAGADSDEARAGRERNALLALREGAGALADQMLPKLLSDGAPDALRDHVRQLIEANPPPGIAAALRAMAARPDSTGLLATVDVPTLVLVGEADALTPPDEAAAMHAAIPGSVLVQLPGAAHLSNLEAAAAFNAALASFLAGLPRP